jgi:hypothetical protein
LYSDKYANIIRKYLNKIFFLPVSIHKKNHSKFIPVRAPLSWKKEGKYENILTFGRVQLSLLLEASPERVLGGVSKLMGFQVAGDASSEGAVAQEVAHHAQQESACEIKSILFHS